MSKKMNQVGEKKYRFESAEIYFSWNEPVENEKESTIKIVWKFMQRGGKIETHSYNRTVAQIETFYIPLLRIIKGYDSVSTALLYVNDTYSKNIYLRIIEEGPNFLSFTGLELDKEGKWIIK